MPVAQCCCRFLPPAHHLPCLSVYVYVCRYFLSTALGLFNKKVVGKNYGVFGKGAFPGAPQQQQQQCAHTCGAAVSRQHSMCTNPSAANCGDFDANVDTLKSTLLAPAPLHITEQQAAATSTACTHTHTYASVSHLCVLPPAAAVAGVRRTHTAPLFLTGVQFAFQNLLARLVFATGLVERVGERMTWREWSKLGEWHTAQRSRQRRAAAATQACSASSLGRRKGSLACLSSLKPQRTHPCRGLLCCAVLCAVLPNGAVTGLDIGFSNASLVHITMSFYTMCKSTTPIFLLAFAFMWGLET